MLKNIFASLFLCTFLSAESFDAFLQRAIKNSPYLNSGAMEVLRSKEEASMLTRYENPSLELEYSRFSPKTGEGEDGYRIAYSQPVRLWGVGDAKNKLAKTSLKSAEAGYEQKKALFVKDISLAFAEYCVQKMLFELSAEELLISKKIYEVSKTRYENGAVSRSTMMQALAAQKKVEIAGGYEKLSFMQSYYGLLRFAGVNEEVKLDAKYDFKVAQESGENPETAVLKARRESFLSEAELYSHNIEQIELFAEYESENEQDIARFGVSLPLPFFNQRTEEKRAAKLRSEENKLLIENESELNAIELKRLDKERLSLEKLRADNQEMLSAELELLDMFEEGYKISNVNILELQEIKNRMISTKKALIHIKGALDKNAIEQNYLRGNYNE